MRKIWSLPFVILMSGLAVLSAGAATIVPNDIQQPGTQPGEVSNLESPDKCDNCHGGYDSAVEPAFNWRGSMMANAGRDPIFWSTLAIAEQDFNGSGDLCIRCHSTGGWYAGHSTPTDGSGLAAGDADGVDCDTCHKMTNPNGAELAGVMNSPFIANDEESPANGYYGSGMLSLSGGNAKLGPYADAVPKHQFAQSRFHRDVSFCGSCHDVSNPAVGDLAHNNGKQDSADPVAASGVPGDALGTKAAFNNFPYQYGIVERTYSEYYAGALSRTLVSDYPDLPADLKAGAIEAAYLSTGGDYADGTARYFSCQTCHMPATTGVGANKAGTPTRTDLPLHDLTGGNYWMPDAILYQNTADTLRLGGGLSTTQIDALAAGKSRASEQLRLAASLSVDGDTVQVTNLTGHKLISGYPEGRRMWLNIKWYDSGEALLREDGAYGPLTVTLDGSSTTVDTILNLEDPNTKIYEAHYAMTQEWASQLIGLGYSSDMVLSYDRLTGLQDYTLGDLAEQPGGTSHETFHFVLNNTVASDDRIPPYGFDAEEARKRNALPVPSGQYLNGDGSYRYWDDFALNPPSGAVSAEIRLMYQPTSWEYIQFLYLANTGTDAFLADEGANLLDTWMDTGMAEPFEMASATWGSPTPVVSISGNVGVEGVSLGYEDGGAKSVRSAANGDYSFTVPSGWSGTVTPGKPGYSFTPTSRSYTNVSTDQVGQDYAATQLEYTLTITSAHGTVTKNPDQATYHYGDRVQLTAMADPGWGFANWSGALSGSTNPDSVTIQGNTSVTANYSQIEYTLTISSAHGTVTKNPDQATYHYGDVVQLTATADPGWSFANWSGDLNGSTNPDSVTIQGNTAVTANYGAVSAGRTPSDYDGDGKTDPAVFEKASGNWFAIGSVAGFVTPALHFGDATNYIAAPGDYDGDGKADPAVFEKATGNWFVVGSSTGFSAPALGLGNDTNYIPVPGDYDGDGRTDPAVFEKATGNWFVVGSSAGFFSPALGFGNTTTHIPMPGDYDGDGRTDAAVFERATGNWFAVGSTDGFFTPALGFGNDTDYIPVPGDYDGDGKTDPAVFQKATGHWLVVGSTEGFFTPALTFGNDADYIPQPGDYDSDGRTDPAVFEKATGNWFVMGSTDGFFTPALGFGNDTDYIPVVK